MSLRSILVRAGALSGVLLLGEVAALLWRTPDANIGLGLLVFAVCFVVAGLLGIFDGRRGSLRSLTPGWLLVAGAVGVVGAVSVSGAGLLHGQGGSAAVLLSDLVGVAPFLAALVALPALVGIAVGGASGRRRTR